MVSGLPPPRLLGSLVAKHGYSPCLFRPLSTSTPDTDAVPGALDVMTSCSNTTREARAPGAGSLVSKSGASKGAVAAVAGDAIGCDFAVTNPSSTVTVKGASVTAGVCWRAGALVLVLILAPSYWSPFVGYPGTDWFVGVGNLRLRTDKGWMGNTGLHGCLLRPRLTVQRVM